ncbi:MAG TPA: GntR family transcriptional regulator [Bryobacteraceae bacterium]
MNSSETASLDRSSPVPLYHQFRLLLQQQIENGAWRPQQRLPTEDDFAARYRISKVTVREALKQLADEGYLRREQGRGTFVSQSRVEQGPRILTSFSQEMNLRSMQAASRVLRQRVILAGTVLAAKLRVALGAPVFSLKRLRLADGEPMGIQTAFVPMLMAPGIEKEDFSKNSLYTLLASRYGLRPVRAQEEHFAIKLKAEQAKLLRVEAGAAALAAERLAYKDDGRPLELTTSVMRGDRYKIVLNLNTYQS